MNAVGASNTTILRSTIANNTAPNGGGGGIDSTAATISIVQSTVSGNTTGGVGGGLYFELDPTDPYVYSQAVNGTTVTDNSAGQYGGGIYTGYYSRPNVSGSIVSGNTSAGSPDLYDPVGNLSTYFSLFGDNTGSLLVESPGDANGNIIGGPTNGVVNAMLGLLSNNGGPTLTHLPLAGSPVIDAGDPAILTGTDIDQRGFERSGIVWRIRPEASSIWDMSSTCLSPFPP